MGSHIDIPTQAKVVEALWVRYGEAGVHGDKDIAFALGVASYEPGQRSAQDALGAGNAINIFDLAPFAAGWAKAKGGQ